MPNHMKNGSSYVAYKATKRRNEIARHRIACARVYGNPADIDGKQAIIDLAVDSGTRLAQWLVESLESQGYEIPESVRPRTMDEAGSADDTPASDTNARHHDEPGTDDPTTSDLRCQADALDAEINRLSEQYRRTDRAICPANANRGQWWADRRAELARLRDLLMARQRERARLSTLMLRGAR